MTKNKSFMTKYNAKGSGLTRMNLCSLSKWRVSWKKNYALCILGSRQNYFPWNHNLTLNAYLYSQHLLYVHENLFENTPHNRRNIVLLHDDAWFCVFIKLCSWAFEHFNFYDQHLLFAFLLFLLSIYVYWKSSETIRFSFR